METEATFKIAASGFVTKRGTAEGNCGGLSMNFEMQQCACCTNVRTLIHFSFSVDVFRPVTLKSQARQATSIQDLS